MSLEPGVLDANVLAYALNVDAPQHEASRALLEAASDSSVTLYVTSQILCELYSIITNPRRVAMPSSSAEAVSIISDVLDLPGLQVLPTPARAVAGWMALLQRRPVTGGRLLWVEIKLSDWVFNAIRSQEVLTLHPDYFRLGKPLERRVYELARKHCGRQRSWQISLELLFKKSGSRGISRRFRAMVKNIAKHDHLPDYRVAFNDETDQVTFYNRESWWEETPKPSGDEGLPPLPQEAYDEARGAAPGYDVYALEGEWREWWMASGKPKLDNAAAAFVGFCRSRNKRAPIQRAKESAWDA
jgi:predicted nucleic acid-binding protein